LLAEAASELDDRPDHVAVAFVVREVDDERAVNLDEVHIKVLEVRNRRIAHAEVIERRWMGCSSSCAPMCPSLHSMDEMALSLAPPLRVSRARTLGRMAVRRAAPPSTMEWMVSHTHRQRPGTPHLLHVVLLLALLPQPLRLGHWDLSTIDIPLTDLYIGLPGTPGHDHTHTTVEDHANHCHEGTASCGSFSAAAGLTIPALAAATLFGLAALALRRLPLAAAVAPASWVLAPIAPPPRPAVRTS